MISAASDPFIVYPPMAAIMALGLYLFRRWGTMQDDATLAHADGRSEAIHDCERLIEEMRVKHRDDFARIESEIQRLRQGIAKLIPLVASEHQATAMQILVELSTPPDPV